MLRQIRRSFHKDGDRERVRTRNPIQNSFFATPTTFPFVARQAQIGQKASRPSTSVSLFDPAHRVIMKRPPLRLPSSMRSIIPLALLLVSIAAAQSVSIEE